MIQQRKCKITAEENCIVNEKSFWQEKSKKMDFSISEDFISFFLGEKKKSLKFIIKAQLLVRQICHKWSQEGKNLKREKGEKKQKVERVFFA